MRRFCKDCIYYISYSRRYGGYCMKRDREVSPYSVCGSWQRRRWTSRLGKGMIRVISGVS